MQCPILKDVSVLPTNEKKKETIRRIQSISNRDSLPASSSVSRAPPTMTNRNHAKRNPDVV